MECKVSDLRCIHDHWGEYGVILYSKNFYPHIFGNLISPPFFLDIFNYLKEPLQDEYINDTRRGMICDCLRGCESLLYLVELNVIPLPK